MVWMFFAIDALTSRINSSLSIAPDSFVGIGLERGSLGNRFPKKNSVFGFFWLSYYLNTLIIISFDVVFVWNCLFGRHLTGVRGSVMKVININLKAKGG